MLGKPFMPHQQYAADVAGEYDPVTGIPYYREGGLTVMRQSGKSIWLLASETDRCVSWRGPRHVTYTAQTGADARKKLLEDHVPILEGSDLAGLLRKVVRGVNDEAVVWRNGSQIDTAASSQSGGHGRSLDLGILDEAWKDQDDRREGALLPAMATVADAQLLWASTMGYELSAYLNRKVDLGRHFAEEDPGAGICYFEWAIPRDEDVYDPAVWRCYMPALCPTPGPCECDPEGRWRHTITEAVIAHAAATMKEAEFRRAFANQRTAGGGERVIDADDWDGIQDPDAKPEGWQLVGVDVNADRASAAIAVCGRGQVELADYGAGVGWLVTRVAAIYQAWGDDAEVVIDGGGPAASVADDLEDAGVPVRRLSSMQAAAACARFYDAVHDADGVGGLRVRPSKALDDAVAGAAKKPLAGGRFVWSREAATDDATPLWAATLAYSRAGQEDASWIEFS